MLRLLVAIFITNSDFYDWEDHILSRWLNSYVDCVMKKDLLNELFFNFIKLFEVHYAALDRSEKHTKISEEKSHFQTSICLLHCASETSNHSDEIFPSRWSYNLSVVSVHSYLLCLLVCKTPSYSGASSRKLVLIKFAALIYTWNVPNI